MLFSLRFAESFKLILTFLTKLNPAFICFCCSRVGDWRDKDSSPSRHKINFLCPLLTLSLLSSSLPRVFTLPRPDSAMDHSRVAGGLVGWTTPLSKYVHYNTLFHDNETNNNSPFTKENKSLKCPQYLKVSIVWPWYQKSPLVNCICSGWGF